MAVLIHPGHWNPKPPLGQQLNSGHQLAQQLIIANFFNESGGSAVSLAPRQLRATLSSSGWKHTRRGPAVFHDATGDKTDFGSLSGILPTSNCTIILGYRKTDATLRASGAFGLTGIVVGEKCHAYLPYSDGTVYWDFGGDVAGTTRLSIGSLSFGDDIWAFTTGPRGMEIWQNGIRRANNAANPSRTNSTASFQLGQGGFVTTSDFFECWLFLVYGRQLDATEIIEVHSNPYSMVLPPQPLRRYFVAPSGGPQSIDLAGSLTGAGTLGNLTSKPFAGSSMGAGALAKQGQKPLAAGLTATGTLLLERVVILLLEGSIALAGTLAKGPQKALSGSSTAAGVLVRQAQKLFLAGSTAAGALAKAVSKPLAGSATASGTLDAIKTALLILTGSLAASGTLAKLSAKAFAGSSTATGSLTRQAQKVLAGSLVGAGTITKAVSKALAGATTGSGAIGLVRVLLMSFAGVLTATGAILKQADKGIGGALTPAGALVRSLAVSLAGSIATAGSLAKAIARTLAGSITATGALDFGAAVRHIIHVLGLDRLFFQQKGADSERLDATGTDSATINRRGQDA